ncbi:MAG: PKD domain-containing protein [Cyclobacteriaceae bacterium]
MNLNKTLLLSWLCYVIFFCCEIKCQTPVNLFNGVAAVSVPLYSAPVGNGATIPIGLGYTASGIRVDQVASSVGLGWNLQAGGAVTRIVRGRPDTGYEEFDPSLTDQEVYRSLIEGSKDGEKDMYYFSIPGRSGAFVLQVQEDETGLLTTPVGKPIPWQDITIIYTSGGFTLVDEGGVEYYFGGSADTEEESVFNVTETATYESANEMTYVSTWFLKEIRYPNVSYAKNVSFTYNTGAPTEVESFSYKTKYELGLDENCDNTLLTQSGVITVKSKTIIGAPKYLSHIDFPLGDIYFHYNQTTRQDLENGLSLDRIQVLNKLDNEVATYQLNYTYFDSNTSYLQGTSYGPCYDPELCKRLVLTSVYNITKGGNLLHRSFEYTTGQTLVGGDWDPFALPPRDSYYTDHWGYYNGGTHQGNTHIAHEDIPELGVPGMDKSSSGAVKAGMLNKVTLPTGGYSTLEYEHHSLGGGARIAATAIYDEHGVQVGGNTYSYAGTQQYMDYPRYHFQTAVESRICNFNPHDVPIITVGSQAKNNLFDFGGANIGYTTVTETPFDGSGRIEHDFVNFSERAEDLAEKFECDYTVSGNVFNKNLIGNDEEPYVSRDIVYLDKGAEKETRVYDAGGVLQSLSETNYLTQTPVQYEFENYVISDVKIDVDGTETEVPGYVASTFITAVGGLSEIDGYRFNSGEYSIVSKPIRPQYTTTRAYKNGQEIANTVEYTFHNDFPATVSQTTSYTNDVFSRTTLRFLADIDLSGTTPEVEAMWRMQDRMLRVLMVMGPVVETISEQRLASSGDYSYVGSAISIFSDEYGPFTLNETYAREVQFPTSTYTQLSSDASGFIMDANLRKTSDMTYDTDGKLLTSTGIDGITTAYGYTNDVVSSISVNERVSTTQSIPLIGVTQSTSPNGRNSHFEYDHFNRQTLTRNHDNEIISRKRYHTHAEATDLGANLQVTGGELLGSELTFTSNNSAAYYGPSRYIWDFDDGTTVETDLPIATHTYSEAGTYIPTVTILNPEYTGSVQVPTATGVVVSDETATASIGTDSFNFVEGTNQFDMCGGVPINLNGALIANVSAGATCSPAGSPVYNWVVEQQSNPLNKYELTGGTLFLPESMGQCGSSNSGNWNIDLTVTYPCGTVLTADTFVMELVCLTTCN